MFSKLRIAVAALLIASVVVIGWLLLTGDRRSSTLRSHGPPPSAAAADGALPSLREKRSPAVETEPDPDRQPLPPSAVATPEPTGPSPKEAVVRGRCVADESGAPLAECVVKLDGSSGNDAAMALHGPVTWTDPAPVTTLADGRFEIRFEPPPPYQYGLNMACPGRVPRTARWSAFQPGQVEDLGDVRFARGAIVRGLVVDTGGNPVRDVGVLIARLPLPTAADMAANDTRVGWSDASGRFEIEVPIPPGTWPLDVQARGYALVEPHEATVDDVAHAVELRVIVASQRYLAGVVVDENGRPVSRVYLKTKTERHGKMEASWTRDDGRFRIFARDDAPETVQLASLDPGPCEPLDDDRYFAWGTTDIRLVMKRALALELTVVESGSGVPVEDFAVKCHPPHARSSRETDVRLGGHHPDGKLIVDKIRRGSNVLRVIPKDLDLPLSDAVSFEASDHLVAPMRVELRRMTPLDVRVIATAGEPIVGSRLELVQRRSERLDLSALVDDPRSNEMISSSSPVPLLLSSATTDADGRAVLHGPAGASGLAIRALGPGHVPVLRDRITLPNPGSSVVIEVERSGSVRGKLTGEAPRAYRARLTLSPSPTPEFELRPMGSPVAPDGSFVFASVPPGEYQVRLAIETGVHDDRGSGYSGWTELLPPLDMMHIESGRETRAELDASAFDPGSLEAHLGADSELLKGSRVTLHGRGGHGVTDGVADSFERTSEWTLGFFVPSPAGILAVDRLPPGEYAISLSFASSPGDSGRMDVPQMVSIRPHEKTICTLEITR